MTVAQLLTLTIVLRVRVSPCRFDQGLGKPTHGRHMASPIQRAVGSKGPNTFCAVAFPETSRHQHAGIGVRLFNILADKPMPGADRKKSSGQRTLKIFVTLY